MIAYLHVPSFLPYEWAMKAKTLVEITYETGHRQALDSTHISFLYLCIAWVPDTDRLCPCQKAGRADEQPAGLG